MDNEERHAARRGISATPEMRRCCECRCSRQSSWLLSRLFKKPRAEGKKMSATKKRGLAMRHLRRALFPKVNSRDAPEQSNDLLQSIPRIHLVLGSL